MNISWDYSELITELNEELNDGILAKNSIIQVLRGDVLFDEYRPIIDWYYDHTTTLSDLEIEDKKQYDQYWEMKEHLEKIELQNCLKEMEYWNSIVKKKEEK